jgi:hypothetical protein
MKRKNGRKKIMMRSETKRRRKEGKYREEYLEDDNETKDK